MYMRMYVEVHVFRGKGEGEGEGEGEDYMYCNPFLEKTLISSQPELAQCRRFVHVVHE